MSLRLPLSTISGRRPALTLVMTALAGLALPLSGSHAADASADRTLEIVSPWEINGLQPASSGFVFQRIYVFI